MNSFLQTLLVVLIVAGLATLFACGGGGGGGGFTPAAYTGSTTQATLDGTNASDYAALAEAGTSFGMIAPIPLAVTGNNTLPADVSHHGLKTLVALGRSLPDYLITDLKPDAQLAAPVSDAGTLFCGIGDGCDGSVYMVATWDADTGGLTASMTFSNCNEGFDAIFNGSVNLVFTGISADIDGNPDLPNTTQFTMDQTYLNLRVTFPSLSETLTMYAVMHFTYDASGINTINTMDMPILVMVLQNSALTAQVKNYFVTITEYNRNTLPSDDDYDEIILASGTVKAELYDHLTGYVSAYTLPGSPLLVEPVTEIPYSGIIRLEGANGSSAEVNFGIACETTGFSGTFDTGAVSATFCYHPL